MRYLRVSFMAVLLMVVATVFSGCSATVPLMDQQYDREAETFQPKPGKGNVYVARSNAFGGSAIAFEIDLDGRGVGSIAPNTYHLFELDPGQHVIAATSAENADHVVLQVEQGQNHFIQVEPAWGMMAARVSVEEIPPEKGRQLVIEGSRAETLPTY